MNWNEMKRPVQPTNDKAMLSVIQDSSIRYPDGEYYYSPDTRYPEYRFNLLAPRKNPVYAAVRQCLAQAGLDERRFGTAEWNPLGQYIRAGSRVFVLCNFVYHRKPRETEPAFQGKCIHGSVLRALLDYVFLATGPTGKITFGNAPLQSCRWDAVLEHTGAKRTLEFFQQNETPVGAEDLRLFVAERGALGRPTHTVQKEAAGQACDIDLGAQSCLAELNGGTPHYRVSDYNPQRTESCHAGGQHRYVVHRSVLESDVLLSLPKLKTHEKVGITCVIKGFVGAVAHKDCLAHHRFGGPAAGGDEYPANTGWRQVLSRLHDGVYGSRRSGPLLGLMKTIDFNVRRCLGRAGFIQAGAWHGNDTAWRMAVDLARIMRYADAQGRMQTVQQRIHLAMIDGIVGGEGAGPLSPQPVNSGALIFGDPSALVDRVAARLMGYDPAKLPMIARAFQPHRYPLASAADLKHAALILNGKAIQEDGLAPALGRPFLPPRGWRNFLPS